jgi:chloramphenicol-sensitive protein RarD
VGPTLQFLIGVLVFQEPFPRARAVGFVLIWTGLAVYAADSLLRRK